MESSPKDDSNCCSRTNQKLKDAYVGFRWLLKQKTTYPMFLLAIIALFLNADQNLIAPNLTQIARDFNFTDIERDTYLGGQLSLGFFLVGGIAAMVVLTNKDASQGYLTDKVNRKNLFVAVIMIGELSCFCTLFVKDYTGLFVTRAITGVSIGGANPLIMSMIGDMFDDNQRGKAISFIQIMLSLGIIVGQSVAGFIGPADVAGWRTPFGVIAAPTFILGPIFFLTTKDPPRGTKEKATQAVIETIGNAKAPEIYEEKMDCSKLKILLLNKTALLAFVQGIPGSLPWGVMLVYFQDFLVQDIGPKVEGGITVQESTAVVLTFGVGSGIGLISGGFLADRLWKKNPRLVPLMMAVTTCIGALPIYGLINGPVLSLSGYAVITLPSGILASMTGTAIRTVLMNVTLPETRGTAFAFHTLFDDIGRGLGPLWVSLLIAGTGGRIPGFNLSVGGWFVCSVVLFLMICTVRGDFHKLEVAIAQAIERRQRGLDEGSLVGVKEVNATTLDDAMMEANDVEKQETTPARIVPTGSIEADNAVKAESTTIDRTEASRSSSSVAQNDESKLEEPLKLDGSPE